MSETITIRTSSERDIVKIVERGPQGAAGAGIPTGGSSGQILRKTSNADYATEWASAGGGAVTSVNGQDGDVVLVASDVGAAQEFHGNQHFDSDPIYNEMVRVQNAGRGSVNGYYYFANDGGDNDYILIGSRRLGKIVERSLRWEIEYNGTAYYRSEQKAQPTIANPWEYTTWTNVTGDSGDNPAPSVEQSHAVQVIDELGRKVDYAGSAKLGSTSGLPVKTGASGIIETGSFGTSAGTFCQGNDARLILAGTASQPGHTHTFYGEIVDSLLDGGEQILADIGAAASSHTHAASAISDSTTAGRALLTAADAAAQRTSLGLGTLATQSGTFSGTSSGTNTGDQTISLTGDVTGSGTGSFAATIANNAVTNAKLAQVATSTLKGRVTASTGNVEDLTATQVRSLLNVADGATANSSDATLLARANHTGTQAASTITGLAAIATSGSASDLTTGTVGTARLGSGSASASTFLAGDQSWKAVSGVTTGSVDNAVLRADGTGGSTSQSSDINIEDAATATQNNVQISNQHSGQTDSALVLTPKGTGALIAGARPTGTSSTGNARGIAATDLQMTRSAATQVASGSYSFIGGGRNNTASANDNVVCGGRGNTAESNYGDTFPATICGGYNNRITSVGYAGFIGGGISNANGSSRGCIAGGDSNTVNAYGNFIGGGDNNDATNTYSSVSCGSYTLADRYGIQAHANGRFGAKGDAQRFRAVLRCKTTTNAAVEMALDGGTNYLTIPSGKVMYGEIYVVGVRSTGADVAIYRIVYCAKNVAGTSTEVFSSVTTDAATGTSLEVATVDAGDYIRIRPTGVLSQTWRWVAKVDMVEVAYGT